MNKKLFAAAVPMAASCALLAQGALASTPPPPPACPPTPVARCTATADLRDFADKIRVTHQETNQITIPDNLFFQVVAPDGTPLGCPVSANSSGVGPNVSVTYKIEDIYRLARVPNWRLAPNVVQVIETDAPHDMQGTITYKNGLVTPLIFTCENATD